MRVTVELPGSGEPELIKMFLEAIPGVMLNVGDEFRFITPGEKMTIYTLMEDGDVDVSYRIRP